MRKTAEPSPVPKKICKNICILIFWLVIWEIAAFLVGSSLILVSPRATFGRLFELSQTAVFWQSIATSMGRIMLGFGIAVVVGIAIASLAYISKIFHMLILPAINVMNAVPFASFIVLALFAMGSVRISIFVPFVMVLPIIFHNTHKGVSAADRQLLEMAKVFRVPWWRVVFRIYAKSAAPFVLAAMQVGIGFAWKSGIAAELIGQVRGTIGGNLHIARIHLQTADLFAWTVAIVLLSYGMEKIIVWAVGEHSSPLRKHRM